MTMNHYIIFVNLLQSGIPAASITTLPVSPSHCYHGYQHSQRSGSIPQVLCSGKFIRPYMANLWILHLVFPNVCVIFCLRRQNPPNFFLFT